jgi:hypothetical protein
VNATSPKTISQSQRARLFALTNEAGLTKERLRELVLEVTGQESTGSMVVADYDRVCALVQAEAVAS